MEFAGNQEGKVIRVPQLRRGKEDVAVSERVITRKTIAFYYQIYFKVEVESYRCFPSLCLVWFLATSLG